MDNSVHVTTASLSTDSRRDRENGPRPNASDDQFSTHLTSALGQTGVVAETTAVRARQVAQAQRTHQGMTEALSRGDGFGGPPRPTQSSRSDRVNETRERQAAADVAARRLDRPARTPDPHDGDRLQETRAERARARASRDDGRESGHPGAQRENRAPTEDVAARRETRAGKDRSSPPALSASGSAGSAQDTTAARGAGGVIGAAGEGRTGASTTFSPPAFGGLNEGQGQPTTARPTGIPQATTEGAGGSSSNATSGQGGKSGGAGVKSAQTAVDFNNLMNAASNRRAGGPGSSGAATSAGKAQTTAKGIDLTQARALNELADVVRANLGPRRSTMTLQLDPPELGRLRIDLRMEADVLTLRFEAETQAGKEALQARLTDLRSALEHHGIQVHRVDVELRTAPPADSGPESHHGQTSSESDTRDATPGERGGDAREDRPDTPGSEPDENPTADPMVSGASLEAERDKVLPPAETGVDLVV